MGRLEVDVNPEIIKWARESAGFSVDEIAKKLKISRESYRALESGRKKPTFKQLELLSKYFMRPLATFLLQKSPEEKTIASSFRILPKSELKFSRDLRLAIRKARYYQSISRELMRDLGIEIETKIKRRTLQEDPKESAKEERQNLGISLDEQFEWENAYEAFDAWRSAIESKNVFVFQFKFPLEDARGFCLVEDPPVIVVNFADNIKARIFTLAHEYAHLALGISEVYSEEIVNDGDVENWCNTFASELLIPQEALEKTLEFSFIKDKKRISPKILEDLSKKFKVSKRAVLVRLRTLSIVDEDVESSISPEQRPVHATRIILPEEKCIQEKGKRFASLVIEGRDREVITTQDALEYLSIKLKRLEKLEKLIERLR
ncbi:MAG: ImmA/IrrE family metallo-endopeptidase [Archaeoglobaceae archaeon]